MNIIPVIKLLSRFRTKPEHISRTLEAKKTLVDIETWSQTQLILTTCQIRYHSHLWDHRSTGQL
jgi:hypothetical protein